MKKADHATSRLQVQAFQQIINVGPATERDFRVLGLTDPQQLIGRDPWDLYRHLSLATKTVQNPCVLDVFMATVDFMNGNPPRPWWHYTAERQRQYRSRLEKFAAEKAT